MKYKEFLEYMENNLEDVYKRQVFFCCRPAGQGFPVGNLLYVVKSASHSTVTICIIWIKVDGCPGIAARIKCIRVKDWLDVDIHHGRPGPA